MGTTSPRSNMDETLEVVMAQTEDSNHRGYDRAVRHLRGRRFSEAVIAAVLLVCASAAITALAAISGLTDRPPEHNIYESWQLALGAPYVAGGAYIAHRSPRHALGWLFLCAGAAVWSTPLLSSTIDRGWLHPGWPARVALFAGGGGWVWWRGIVLALVPLAYPTGRLWRDVSWFRRLTLLVVGAAVLGAGLCNALTFAAIDFATFTPYSWVEPFERAFGTMLRVVAVLALLTQADLVLRVARMAPPDRRRHAVFVVAGIVLTAPSWVSLAQSIGWVGGYDWPELEFVPALFLPVALAYGVLRHAALGFRTVVRRTAFYTGVTVVSAALYLAVVGAFAAALRDGVGIGPVLATGLVAVSLQPVRALVQRVVDCWVFGDRDDPDHALAGLSRRLGDADSDPLTVVAEVVRSSLKLAAVAIVWVDDAGDEVVGARAVGGVLGGEERRRRILFEGRHVGDLVVYGAEGASAANAAEERLLAELAGAAGAVVQAVRSADDLARSRGLIVRAREEERRRLRHDLHDGLGPTLASVAMGLDAAANRLRSDPELSDLLHDLDRALRDAIADIRRLVAGLRPPAIDDVGLVPALREQARDLAARSRRPDGVGLAIEVVSHPGVPALGAAVEVAAYRIAIEGMTNVLRHAEATQCRVRLAAVDDSVEVTVEDDGRGIADSSSTGIGLESMRNRAEELGGRLHIGDRPGGGTLLTAVLPLHGAESGLVPA